MNVELLAAVVALAVTAIILSGMVWQYQLALAVK
jgi:hypothetical protein